MEESPYPTETVVYRLSQLERWREQLEQDGIPVAFAKIEARLDSQDLRIGGIEVLLGNLQSELQNVKETSDRTQGMFSGWKAAITIGVFGLIMAGNFVLGLVGMLG